MIFRTKLENRIGSMLLGSILVLLILSIVSVALLNRSIQGAHITSDARKGYVAYQGVDAESEQVLNKLRKLDNNSDKYIPENTCAWGSDYCGDGNTKCADVMGDDLASSGGCDSNSSLISKADSLAYMKGIEKKSTTNGLERSISVPFLDRIQSGLSSSSLTVDHCGTGVSPCTWNKCDLKVTLNPSDVIATTDKIKDYQLRRSTSKKLGDLTYGWWTWNDFNGKTSVASSPTDSGQIIMVPNGDEHINDGMSGKQTGGQYSQTYSFAVKARNKNPLSLDSLYLNDGDGTDPEAVSSITTDLTNCPDESNLLHGLGCVKLHSTDQPVGTEPAKYPYNCCNNTECLQPIEHWDPDPPGDCALQECGNDSDGYLGASEYHATVKDSMPVTGGDYAGLGIIDGLGWCKTAVACVPGSSCTHPYRVVGYCSSGPDPSALTAGIASTSWSPQNKIDVDMNPSAGNGKSFSPYEQIEPRCYRHDCPTAGSVVADANVYCGSLPEGGSFWNASSTKCDQDACGEYALNKECALNCSSGYYPSLLGNAGYPDGKCCYQDCPPAPYADCGSVSHGSFANNSTCTHQCATATQNGYVVAKKCNLTCDSGWYKDGTKTAEYPDGDKCSCVDQSCPAAPSCTYGYSGSCVDNGCTISDTRVCNACVDQSCPAEPSCTYGYTGTCVDNGCTISDTRTCNDPPSCSLAWGSPVYYTSGTKTINWSSSASTSSLEVIGCVTPVGYTFLATGAIINEPNGSFSVMDTWTPGWYWCVLRPKASNGDTGPDCVSDLMYVWDY